jgi:lipopolysaccharide export LptBFGC system permease protein LptF
MRVLKRTVLREVLLLGGFYGVCYLGLIAVGAAMPLIKQGAPIDGVLAFIPEQLLLFSIIALPLAMVTAFLACIGRMREDGELTALMAAGVGTWKVAKATLPVAVLLAVWLGFAAHLLLPPLAGRLLAGRSQLMRQALAAQVERRTPVWQDAEGILAANAAEGDRLIGVFGVRIDPAGGISALFAPSARWVADPGDEENAPSLAMEMHDARAVSREAGGNARITTAVVPALSVRLQRDRVNLQNSADALSTPELWKRLKTAPETTARQQRSMRNYERAWHLRFMLPVACLAFWAFACGVAFAAGRGNRMLAVCLGVVTVVATLFPAFVLAKEVGERLPINAAVWVWPPPFIIGAIGAWLLWRNR